MLPLIQPLLQMKKPLLFLLSMACPLLLASCFDHWTEQERKAFKAQCSQIDTFSYVKVQFSGFDSVELTPLIVQEYLGSQLLDDFKLDVPMLKAPNEAVIERTLYGKRRYVFKLPGGQNFELANMEMVMWPQWTMLSEGYGCVMASYTIDGVHHGDLYPTFVKKLQTN